MDEAAAAAAAAAGAESYESHGGDARFYITVHLFVTTLQRCGQPEVGVRRTPP